MKLPPEQQVPLTEARKVLDETVEHFMSNLGSIVSHLTEMLKRAAAENRDAAPPLRLPLPDDATGTASDITPPGSPVSRKRRIDPNFAPLPPSDAISSAIKAAEPSVAPVTGPVTDTPPADAPKLTEKQMRKAFQDALPDNSLLLKQLQTLKVEARSLSLCFERVHDWIALNLPEMAQEDNAQALIMGTMLGQVMNVLTSVKSIYELEGKYLVDRALSEQKLYRIMRRGPSVSTVSAVAMLHSDERMAWEDCHKAWRTLVRSTLLLHSMLSKNMERLRSPRSTRASHHHGMYM